MSNNLDYTLEKKSSTEAEECSNTPCEMRCMSAEQADKIRIHKQLTEKLHTLYETKNMDYGDSMHPLFKEFGLQAFLVMFHIKINRIKSLQYRKANYEGIEDSLLDLANYALIALTEITEEREQHENYNK